MRRMRRMMETEGGEMVEEPNEVMMEEALMNEVERAAARLDAGRTSMLEATRGRHGRGT